MEEGFVKVYSKKCKL